MSADIVTLPTSLPIARIKPTAAGWTINCRGPHGARHYDFTSASEAGEFAVVLRDEGGWRLRFSIGTDAVQAIVEEIDGEAA